MPLQKYINCRNTFFTSSWLLELDICLSRGDNAWSCDNLINFLNNIPSSYIVKDPFVLFGIFHQCVEQEKYLMAARLIDDYDIAIPFDSTEWIDIKNKCITSTWPSAKNLLSLLTPREERHNLISGYSAKAIERQQAL